MSFGIDFGTTNSVLAKFDGQEAVAVPIDAGNLDDWNYRGFDLLFPTVVGYSSTRPELLFGWEGKLRAEENVEAVKRLLRGDDEVGLAGRSFAASTVVAGFFDALRRRGLDQDVDVQRAVVTVPANSTGAARYRTRAAARLGGVQVQALLNEPTAAAIAYVHDAGAPKDIMVFDWGGGTVDVTVLEYDEEDGLFEERASRGIAELGGLEIDERLGQLVLRKLGSPPSWAPFEWDQFKRDIERTKIRLSTEEFVVLTTPDFTRTVEIERAEFEAEITDLVERSMAPLAHVPGRPQDRTRHPRLRPDDRWHEPDPPRPRPDRRGHGPRAGQPAHLRPAHRRGPRRRDRGRDPRRGAGLRDLRRHDARSRHGLEEAGRHPGLQRDHPAQRDPAQAGQQELQAQH